jgi:prevent-host-death family protein
MPNTSYREVGAFEAKAKLSEILRKVEQGERYTITRRGRVVAHIVPAQNQSAQAREEALSRLMRPQVTGIPGDTVLRWIREGRKQP